mmetsp:Transcript_10881/g.17981  ORF Transcript_10881/g.17981 Transcript_10881/m.17981 type:complete len:210 (-) Transcript_10881:59-688(-)|eukprot:CAMPEP_0169068964 /NCGR_PEP_ID=MMETSP1015-20121227/4313_1 /TAXON_ID=342587 /ORGANISM="Karlodinium micrum, Strain CCMP2283" /LENGTH=209 /DNA_ID=CAMNT_0009127831 /DNA_START=47 /DNA_END=676 /DNA_ORIENTATION=+
MAENGALQENIIDAVDLEATRTSLLEERTERVLKQNVQLCNELRDLGKELENARAMEEELQVQSKAASSVVSRQKMVAQNLQKRVEIVARSELQKLTESANQICELKNVHSQLETVSRQLDFAVSLQTQALTHCDNKIAAKSRKIRKLELAIYQMVSQAQCDESLEKFVPFLVSKCGPLVHNVLSREAQRQAMELVAREDAERAALEAA